MLQGNVKEVTKQHIIDLFGDTHCSIADINEILAFFIDHFGPEWFEQGSMKCIQDYCKSMDIYCTTETVVIKEGNFENIVLHKYVNIFIFNLQLLKLFV